MAILKLRPPDKIKSRWWPPEYREQITIAQYLDKREYLKACWFHTPNGGYRGSKTGYWLRKFGAKPGVPDILIMKPLVYKGQQYVGLAMELKRRIKSYLSVCQKHWLAVFDSAGFLTVVAYGSRAALPLIKEAYPKDHPPVLLTSSNRQRRDAVTAALLHPTWSQMSDRAIGRYTGSEGVTVARIRSQMLAKGTLPAKDTVDHLWLAA